MRIDTPVIVSPRSGTRTAIPGRTLLGTAGRAVLFG